MRLAYKIQLIIHAVEESSYFEIISLAKIDEKGFLLRKYKKKDLKIIIQVMNDRI